MTKSIVSITGLDGILARQLAQNECVFPPAVTQHWQRTARRLIW